MPRGAAKGRGGAAGRNAKVKSRNARDVTPPHHEDAASSDDESQQPSVSVDTPQEKHSQACDEMPPVKRKKAPCVNLTREQETSIIDWLKDHPELFDKADASYKDITKKKSLWDSKAEELGLESGAVLLTWYRSMRTRYGKLQKNATKSGAGSPQLTQRDQWILRNFSFFKPHIYVCPKRAPGLVSKISLSWSLLSLSLGLCLSPHR